MFVDEAIVEVTGGNGGNGCVAWRREKYVPRGGPDGGDGGRGGNVVFVADPNTDTLSDYSSAKRFQAPNGEHGTGKNCKGHSGEDLILRVPPGTIIVQADTEDVRNAGRVLADLREKGDKAIVSKGGRGGYGNSHFTTSTRQAPDFAELGEPGHTTRVKLELKLVADVGIIGFPSVGKSSLIAAMSSAKPKIAEYEFTTLVPNLGVVKAYDREFVLCDIPGLIEGASEGKGLGDKFLRHIERCGILVHLIDINRPDIVADYKAIRNELEAYSPTLAKKKEVVVLNKIDLVGDDYGVFVDELKKSKIKVFAAVSAATKHGTKELVKKLLPLILKEKERRQTEETDKAKDGDELQIVRPHLESDLMGVYRIEKKKGKIIILGKRLEQFTKMTNFENVGALQRFLHVIDRIGLRREIDKKRTEEESVYIGKMRVDEYL